jgi:2-polyprenyl-6-methoxyphenol hydroxylase-like FAD-dependent oxidoreductase
LDGSVIFLSREKFPKMSAPKPIQIIGGGLAGLTLGIALRKKEIPVTIFEASSYPRHRVCGEFISGRGQAALARLGLDGLFFSSGATPASTAAFFSETKSTAPRTLPADAICLSRFILDHALAEKFRELGGELFENHRFTENFSEGIVRASGRRAQAVQDDSRWFGLKIHARNVALAADLEMHFSSRGYVGLCKLADGEVNVCGIFRKRPGENSSAQNARELLRGNRGSILNRRFAAADFDENSFCAVAGISLRPQRAAAREEICVGDAITMIPPVTGNGMSMAFESAELAIDPLTAWSRGEISWLDAKQKIARACDEQFSSRLRWAKWLQRFLLSPKLQSPLLAFASRSDWFWRMAFERTR